MRHFFMIFFLEKSSLCLFMYTWYIQPLIRKHVMNLKVVVDFTCGAVNTPISHVYLIKSVYTNCVNRYDCVEKKKKCLPLHFELI